jgi:hypothetical protein
MTLARLFGRASLDDVQYNPNRARPLKPHNTKALL